MSACSVAINLLVKFNGYMVALLDHEQKAQDAEATVGCRAVTCYSAVGGSKAAMAVSVGTTPGPLVLDVSKFHFPWLLNTRLTGSARA